MKQLKGIVINICTTCHMRCRHCSNTDTLRDSRKIDAELVHKCISEAAVLGIEEITIVGGEPFDELEVLSEACNIARVHGRKLCIITNGSWARDRERGAELLSKLPGITSIIVSSDLYHLEYVSEETVRNVVELCRLLHIDISIHASCASRADAKKVRNIYKDLMNCIFINTNQLMPIGAAKTLNIERFMLGEKIDSLMRFCGAGKLYVDTGGDVYGCCNACLGDETFLYYGNLYKTSLSEAAELMEKDGLYQYMVKAGPRGLKKLLEFSGKSDDFMHKYYTCECDACIDILRNIKFDDQLFNKSSQGEREV